MELREEYEKQQKYRSWLEILELLPIDNNQIIADLGCGIGEFTEIASEKVKHVIAVDRNRDLLNNLKEKNIKSITPDRRALILFDGIPGIIFKGTVENISPILAQGYSTSSSLVNIPTDNRWIRDNGKIRVSIIAENSKSIKHLSSGSMASVILLSETNNIFYNFLAKIWINIIMVFNYVY